MVSERKLQANRMNALKSTGPRTQQGKAIASANSTRHGLYASQALLDGDDPTEFEALHTELCDDLQPNGAMQRLLVDRIAVLAWRLRRIGDIEAAMIRISNETHQQAHERERGRNLPVPAAERIAERFLGGGAFDALSQYDQRLQRGMQSATRQLMQLKKQNGDASDKHRPNDRPNDLTDRKARSSDSSDLHLAMIPATIAPPRHIAPTSAEGEFDISSASSRLNPCNLRNEPTETLNLLPGQQIAEKDLRPDRPSVQSRPQN